MKIAFTILFVFVLSFINGQNAISTINESFINFKTGSAKLSNETKKELDSISSKLISNPDYRLKISTYCTGGQFDPSYDRIKEIIQYLLNRKILDSSRYFFDWKADVGLNIARLNEFIYKVNTTCEPMQTKIMFSKGCTLLSTTEQKN